MDFCLFMARLLRIEYADAWYYVTNTAVTNQEIFKTSEHFKMFLELLDEIFDKFTIEVHAYCLLSTQYHLLIRTPYPNLSNAMRYLNGLFAQKLNRLNKQGGPLFRGRYKAILIEKEHYLFELNRYIHLMPLCAGFVVNLEDYLWSSYKYYLGVPSKPMWLFCDETLNHFKSDNKTLDFKKFIAEGIGHESKLSLDDSMHIPILGSDEFIKLVKKEYCAKKSIRGLHGYCTIKQKILPKVDDVLEVVASHYNVSKISLLKTGRKMDGNLPRRIAIYLAFKISELTQKRIAREFEDISYRSVAQTCQRVRREMLSNVALANEIEKLKEALEARVKKTY
jgi:putative transposase